MCIIVYVPRGIEVTQNILQTCFVNNPDGAGLMYQNGNSVVIQKGFMDFARLYNAYSRVSADVDRVLHFRIATSGGINGKNCHPFPLTNDLYDMQKLKNITTTGIAHNGIISMCAPKAGLKDKFSDTMYFIRDYLSKLGNDIDRQEIRGLIQQATGSRFAIMTAEKVVLIGDFNTADGVFFSNYSYEDYSDLYAGYYTTTTTSTKGTKKGKSYGVNHNVYGIANPIDVPGDDDAKRYSSRIDNIDDYYQIDICLRKGDSGKALQKLINDIWDTLDIMGCRPLAYCSKYAERDEVVTFDVVEIPDANTVKIEGRWWYCLDYK